MEVMMVKRMLGLALAFFACLCADPEEKASTTLFDSVTLAKSTKAAVVDVYAYRDNDKKVFLPFELSALESVLFGSDHHGNSSGTGCIINSDGIIVTCNHVVEQATRIFVGFNGQKIKATKIFSNPMTDVAFLKIDAKNLPSLKLANSKTQIDLGESVLVAGNASGKTRISHGLISCLNKVVDGKVLLQSDATIRIGNSGGPMVNAMGEMIGMAFAIPRSGGLSFFIPASMIGSQYSKEILKRPSPWWGVHAQIMDLELLDACGLKDQNVSGVILTSIDEGSPASGILQKGDVIIEVNNQKLSTPEELDFFEKTSILNEIVNIKIWRDNSFQNVNLIPAQEPQTTIQNVDNEILGQVQFEQTQNGVIVKQPNASGLFQKGDKVLEINKKKIKTIQDIERSSKASGDALSVVIDRNGMQIFQSFSERDGGSFFSQTIVNVG